MKPLLMFLILIVWAPLAQAQGKYCNTYQCEQGRRDFGVYPQGRPYHSYYYGQDYRNHGRRSGFWSDLGREVTSSAGYILRNESDLRVYREIRKIDAQHDQPQVVVVDRRREGEEAYRRGFEDGFQRSSGSSFKQRLDERKTKKAEIKIGEETETNETSTVTYNDIDCSRSENRPGPGRNRVMVVNGAGRPVQVTWGRYQGENALNFMFKTGRACPIYQDGQPEATYTIYNHEGRRVTCRAIVRGSDDYSHLKVLAEGPCEEM